MDLAVSDGKEGGEVKDREVPEVLELNKTVQSHALRNMMQFKPSLIASPT